MTQIFDDLPPLLVTHNGVVIDGDHRLEAARQLGRRVVPVITVECTGSERLVRALTANATHGLPLSAAERKAAVAHVLVAHHEWSDRRVATMCGVSPRTVAAVRRDLPSSACPREDEPHLDTEPDTRTSIGVDGKRYPRDVAARRVEAARLAEENPGMSGREIARRSGLSPTVAAKVKAEVEQRAESSDAKGRPTANRQMLTTTIRRLRSLLRSVVSRFVRRGTASDTTGS